MQYEPVIGLEVHIQLKTNTKIFCNCSTEFGAEPNSQVCPVCLGMPGVLPVLNKRVIEFVTRFALATDSRINRRSVFARKNYFYPDLPKAYQISQFDEPFCEHGHLAINIDGHEKTIGITRIHLEEDAGKSLHAESFVGRDETLVDINRCGVPLAEIVSEPDFRSPTEAYEYLVRLRQIVRYLGICDGNMEEGSLRCDANISLRPVSGDGTFGVKTELKNMNSFRSVEKALEFEIHRQELILEEGGTIDQQTLLWDANRNVAEPMRSKEYSHDYRYFPEPDLVPVIMEQEYINNVKADMPELPQVKFDRFTQEFGLPEYDARVLTETPELANYFENIARKINDKKLASNWVMGPVLRTLKEENCTLHELKITPERLAELLKLLEDEEISTKSAETVFEDIRKNGTSPKKIVEEKGLKQIKDEGAIENAVENVVNNNPAEVKAYLNGKDKLLGFFMGQAMKETRGKADPKKINELLRQRLSALKEKR